MKKITNKHYLEQLFELTHMSSLDVLKVINYYREDIDGKNPLLHKTFLSIIRSELKRDINEQKLLPVEYVDSKGEKRPMYYLTSKQAKRLLLRESVEVREAVVDYIEELETKVAKLEDVINKSKRERLDFTDELKKIFGDDSDKLKFKIINYTKLVNNSAGLACKDDGNENDIETIDLLQRMVLLQIKKGKNYVEIKENISKCLT